MFSKFPGGTQKFRGNPPGNRPKVITATGGDGIHELSNNRYKDIASITRMIDERQLCDVRFTCDLLRFRPVSAYALFFRDTQAAIKCQNPSASFGEMSKIVAAMWDTLDDMHKNVSSARRAQSTLQSVLLIPAGHTLLSFPLIYVPVIQPTDRRVFESSAWTLLLTITINLGFLRFDIPASSVHFCFHRATLC